MRHVQIDFEKYSTCGEVAITQDGQKPIHGYWVLVERYVNISLRDANEIFNEGSHPKVQVVVLVFLSSSFSSASLLVSPPFTTPILLHLRRCADSAFLFLA